MNSDRTTQERTERALLAGVIMTPTYLDELPPLPSKMFNWPRHEELWDVLVDEHNAGRPIDPLTLSALLPDGGTGTGLSPVFIQDILAEGSSTLGHAKRHAETIRAAFKARGLHTHGVRAQQVAQETAPEDIDAALDAARANLDALAEDGTMSGEKSMAEILDTAILKWTGQDHREVIPTGWGELDDLFNGGWVPGQLTVVAGRPGQGKTLMATCAATAAMDHGVAFFSLEMKDDELMARIAASFTGIYQQSIAKGEVPMEYMPKLREFRDEFVNSRFKLTEKTNIPVAYMRACLRSWMREHPVRVVVVDYLQLVAPDRRHGPSEERQLSGIANDLKVLAKELNVHVIALAQMNRENQKREDAFPRLSDIKGSGGIEAAADNVIMMHMDAIHEDDDDATVEAKKQHVYMVLRKNRHGENNVILKMAFRPQSGAINSQSGSQDPRNFPHGIPSRIAGWRAAHQP